MYSNPVVINREGVTFNPLGNMPYNVTIRTDTWIPINVLVFSDTKEHAIDTVKTTILKAANTKSINADYESLNRQRQQAMIDIIKTGKIEVTEINLNQLYKIGWADNDTIIEVL